MGWIGRDSWLVVRQSQGLYGAVVWRGQHSHGRFYGSNDNKRR